MEDLKLQERSAAEVPAAPGAEMPPLLTVSPSPHARQGITTSHLMRDVIIALLPATVWGVYVYGLRAALVILFSVLSCVLSEVLFQILLKRTVTISDCSAILTGLLLGLNLPPNAPFYVPIVGGVFAIVVVKQLFGGIGKNVMNPALAARVFLMLTWTNAMTKTPAAAESSPCWSPDGRKIAYVSDQTRNPQIYICDVASRQSTRYTSKGRQNTHPDWAKNGRLCWSSLQAGQWCVMASEPNGGEASARMVTQPGTWQDPSWAADGRHLVASRDKAIFLVDTEPDGDKPVQLFLNKGNWMNPAFSK